MIQYIKSINLNKEEIMGTALLILTPFFIVVISGIIESAS